MKTVIDELDFLKQTDIIQLTIRKKKDFFMLAAKLKMHDPSNTKEYYQSYLKRKNAKLGKATKNNYPATKNYQKLKYW